MQDISNGSLARMLRTQAWERAKGELRSMLHTFHTTSGVGFHGQFGKLNDAMNDFIQKVEDHGLHE